VEALLAQQIMPEHKENTESISLKGKHYKKCNGGFYSCLESKSFIFCISLKKLLYACKENTLEGKKVSKLYLYSIQFIMSEHEKNRSFTSLLGG
jgi:hypothetical protein